jgi:hypothetical protein
MAGKFALIIGNSRYDDSSLGRLRAPDLDVQGLEAVLKAPDVGHFDEVTTLLNEECASVRKAIARFYDQRQRDDLLFLYFSGHGVKDEQGHLYLALRDTESALLAGTAVETAFITGRMDRSFSKRQVLVLDCCHSGAFAYGAKAAQGVSVGTAEAFEGTGVGRVVLTATDSTQYAWEGDRIVGDAQNSLFTHFLIDGLKTGAADRDDDGVVTVDELYDYVREQVVNTTPRQTPYKWTYRQQGDIILAQNPFVKRSTLPPEIEEAINSKLSSLRLEAVRDLETLLRGHHVGRARAALAALKNLSLDDSRKVANAAVEALRVCDEEDRRRRVGPHLAAARAAIEEKQFERALESLRQASHLDAQAEGLAELMRLAEQGQAGSDVVASATALPIDHDSARALHAEVQPPVAAEAARRPESPASPDDRTESFTSDIFISYAREDREKARALADLLGARGWRVWWDRKIAPGEAFDVVIERELCTCRCALVLWSANSVNATWVRNEARRASRRRVLVPILIDHVETPLEFENLQAADLTSWEPAAANPELDAVLDRIQALSPIPYDRLARSAVEDARREFGAGRREAAIGNLERFRPIHDVVTRALTELRAQAERIEQERAEPARRAAEAAQRQRELGTEKSAIDDLVEGGKLRAAEQPLATAEKSESVDVDVAVVAHLRTDSWLASRPVHMAVAGLLVLMVGIWLARVGLGRAPAGPPALNVPSSPASAPVADPAPAPVAERAPASIPTESPSPKSTPIEVVQPKPAVVQPILPAVAEISREASPSSRLEQLRARARTQVQSGQRAQALNTVVEGLQLNRKDSTLRTMLDSLLGDAQVAAQRSKQHAIDLDASARAEDAYSRGLQKQKDAEKQRRAGRIDAATQSFWAAAEQFNAAAAESRRMAKEEEAEQQTWLKKKESERAAAPPRQQPKVSDPAELEQEAQVVRQTLQRYEAAYASLRAESVRSVYPSAPIDQLAKDFADYRSYTMTIQVADTKFFFLSETRTSAIVTAHVIHEVVPKSGRGTQVERAQTFTLEKQGKAWVIVQIR